MRAETLAIHAGYDPEETTKAVAVPIYQTVAYTFDSADHGAALFNFYAHGELKAEGSSVAEGIGQGRITANLEGAPIDTQFRISDEEGIYWVGRLLKEEGLCLGLSTGINVAGAVALAKQLGPGHVIVTILCDTGFRYLSTLYNRDWLRSKGLPVFEWLDN